MFEIYKALGLIPWRCPINIGLFSQTTPSRNQYAHNMPSSPLTAFLPASSQDTLIAIILTVILALFCHLTISLILQHYTHHSESSGSDPSLSPTAHSTPSYPSPTPPFCHLVRSHHGQPSIKKLPVIEIVVRRSPFFLCHNAAPEDEFTIRVEVRHDQYVVIAQLAGFLDTNM